MVSLWGEEQAQGGEEETRTTTTTTTTTMNHDNGNDEEEEEEEKYTLGLVLWRGVGRQPFLMLDVFSFIKQYSSAADGICSDSFHIIHLKDKNSDEIHIEKRQDDRRYSGSVIHYRSSTRHQYLRQYRMYINIMSILQLERRNANICMTGQQGVEELLLHGTGASQGTFRNTNK